MSIRRMRTLALVLVLFLLAVSVSGSALGQPASQSSAAITIPYSGQLTDDLGNPVADGMYAIQFSLYTAARQGELLWTETHPQVQVTGGSFAVVLGIQAPLPAWVQSEKAWLEVSLKAPGAQDFTPLASRQSLTYHDSGEATASSSCAHTHFGETWLGNIAAAGLTIDNRTSTDPRGQGLVVYASPSDPLSAIYGQNDFWGRGVTGFASQGTGVYGSGMKGVMGEANSSGYGGVEGLNATEGGIGVQGFGGSYGVRGGVLYDPQGEDGKWDVYLDGTYGTLGSLGQYLEFYSNKDVRFNLDNNNDNQLSSFTIVDGSNQVLWSISESAGSVIAGKQASIVQTSDQGQRLMYSIQGTGVWLEDVGSSSLVNGEQVISFDKVYAATASLDAGYQVFVTAACDQPVLIYVSEKTAAGFTVKGVFMDGSPSSCPFDYRVVAPRAGYESTRLEVYTEEVQP